MLPYPKYTSVFRFDRRYMPKTALAIGALLSSVAMTSLAKAATILQTATFSPVTASDWVQITVGSVSLAQGTNSVSALTATASVQDQGWGGYDYLGNQLRVGLFDGASLLWSERIAGAGRDGFDPIEQTFDITDTPSSLVSLNDTLATLDWQVVTDLRLDAYTNGLGWPGWSITVNSGSFTVASSISAVPVPAGGFALLSGLTLLGAVRRARKCS